MGKNLKPWELRRVRRKFLGGEEGGRRGMVYGNVWSVGMGRTLGENEEDHGGSRQERGDVVGEEWIGCPIGEKVMGRVFKCRKKEMQEGGEQLVPKVLQSSLVLTEFETGGQKGTRSGLREGQGLKKQQEKDKVGHSEGELKNERKFIFMETGRGEGGLKYSGRKSKKKTRRRTRIKCSPHNNRNTTVGGSGVWDGLQKSRIVVEKVGRDKKENTQERKVVVKSQETIELVGC